MFTRLYITAAVMALACVPASAEVYKWVDDAGEVFYSDRPMDDKAATVAVKSRRTDNARISAQKQARVELETRQSAEQATAEEETRKVAEDQERMTENCRRATEALASLRNAERLYVPLEDGGRKYLDADETRARLAQASKDVDEWCQS